VQQLTQGKTISKLQELQAQQVAIAKAIAEEKTKEKKEQIAIVRDLIKRYEITLNEAISVLKTRKKSGTIAKKVSSTTAGGKRRGRPPVKKA